LSFARRSLPGLILFALAGWFPAALPGQAPPTEQTVPSLSQSNVKRTTGPGAPGPREVIISAISQIAEKPWYRLRGRAEIETPDLILRAEEVDYNEETGDVEARKNVFYHRFDTGEEILADRVEYNIDDETGKYFDVKGWAKPRITARPHFLTTTSPFYFEGAWAERIENRYILHDGFITGCKLPRPWWTLKGPKFVIVPDERAIAYRSIYRLKGIPLFYAPIFYKSLAKEPRQSGFLTPNIGNSSIKGIVLGGGYYWAPSRSYDFAYRGDYFSKRGVGHQAGIRGKPRANTDYSLYLFGVEDKLKQGGFLIEANAKSDLGHGFQAVGNLDYLSSLIFREAFTDSFNEAIFSEVHSVGYIAKHWSSYDLNFVASRTEEFQSTLPHDEIVIRKLPEVDFASNDRQIWNTLPIWFSFDSSLGLLRRGEASYETRAFVDRMDLAPRITAALRWKGLQLIPSFSERETHWGEQRSPDTADPTTGALIPGQVSGQDVNRTAREISLDLVPPSLSRTFLTPKWLGEKMKHVIEPRANFLYVSGVTNFDKLIRFDDTELLADTQQVELSLTNRLYVKRNGDVSEFMSWEVFQQRYFDPTFGGVIVPGQRNVVLSAVELTPFAFLNGPRNYSPVVSVYRLNPFPGYSLEWRADYDPLRHTLANGGLTADFRHSVYYFSMGQSFINSIPALSPNANQVRVSVGVGNENRRGWNAGMTAVYDYHLGALEYSVAQATYNTDCCGLSVQFRRFDFGTRDETQFRVAFQVANVGSFGTMRKQETLF
jgi:LPS-assembly protein